LIRLLVFSFFGSPFEIAEQPSHRKAEFSRQCPMGEMFKR
jgi:hypothetical protein